MRKQRKRIYAGLLCICLMLSLVSAPVSAAETKQAEDTQQHAETASARGGLSAPMPKASGTAEVSTSADLTSALENSTIGIIKLVGDITIDTTLKVNRTVTLDLNGNVFKYENSTNPGRVIAVESGNMLTIEDSDTTTQHKFTLDASGL